MGAGADAARAFGGIFACFWLIGLVFSVFALTRLKRLSRTSSVMYAYMPPKAFVLACLVLWCFAKLLDCWWAYPRAITWRAITAQVLTEGLCRPVVAIAVLSYWQVPLSSFLFDRIKLFERDAKAAHHDAHDPAADPLGHLRTDSSAPLKGERGQRAAGRQQRLAAARAAARKGLRSERNEQQQKRTASAPTASSRPGSYTVHGGAASTLPPRPGTSTPPFAGVAPMTFSRSGEFSESFAGHAHTPALEPSPLDSVQQEPDVDDAPRTEDSDATVRFDANAQRGHFEVDSVADTADAFSAVEGGGGDGDDAEDGAKQIAALSRRELDQRLRAAVVGRKRLVLASLILATIFCVHVGLAALQDASTRSAGGIKWCAGSPGGPLMCVVPLEGRTWETLRRITLESRGDVTPPPTAAPPTPAPPSLPPCPTIRVQQAGSRNDSAASVTPTVAPNCTATSAPNQTQAAIAPPDGVDSDAGDPSGGNGTIRVPPTTTAAPPNTTAPPVGDERVVVDAGFDRVPVLVVPAQVTTVVTLLLKLLLAALWFGVSQLHARALINRIAKQRFRVFRLLTFALCLVSAGAQFAMVFKAVRSAGWAYTTMLLVADGTDVLFVVLIAMRAAKFTFLSPAPSSAEAAAVGAVAATGAYKPRRVSSIDAADKSAPHQGGFLRSLFARRNSTHATHTGHGGSTDFSSPAVVLPPTARRPSSAPAEPVVHI